MNEAKALPSTLEELNYNEVKVVRNDVRDGKIIIAIEPGLMSDTTFAVNPFYSEGDAKNQLQSTSYIIEVTETAGKVSKCVAGYGSGLSHFTKGHRQIHGSMRNLFLTKLEVAVFEVLTTDAKYLLDDSRMNKMIENLDCDKEREHVSLLIDSRLSKIRDEEVEKAKLDLLSAMQAYEDSIIGK